MKRLAPLWIATLVVSCAPVPAAPPRSLVAFASNRNGNTDLYMSRVDGSGLRRLTSDPAPDQFPRCSPDRRSIVFVRGDGRQPNSIGSIFATAPSSRLNENAVHDYTPHWSPDGRSIDFTRRDGAHDRVAVMNADGSGVHFPDRR